MPSYVVNPSLHVRRIAHRIQLQSLRKDIDNQWLMMCCQATPKSEKQDFDGDQNDAVVTPLQDVQSVENFLFQTPKYLGKSTQSLNVESISLKPTKALGSEVL